MEEREGKDTRKEKRADAENAKDLKREAQAKQRPAPRQGEGGSGLSGSRLGIWGDTVRQEARAR